MVDNVHFVDSPIDACQWFYREVPHGTPDSGEGGIDDENSAKQNNYDVRRLVFEFGAGRRNPQLICQVVEDASS